MRRYGFCFSVLLFVFFSTGIDSALGQDAESTAAPGDSGRGTRDKKAVEIFLDDEKLEVEADIPSVDLVMSFKGGQYDNALAEKDFLGEIGEAVKRDPF